jgi:hypothetical protein
MADPSQSQKGPIARIEIAVFVAIVVAALVAAY